MLHLLALQHHIITSIRTLKGMLMKMCLFRKKKRSKWTWKKRKHPVMVDCKATGLLFTSGSYSKGFCSFSVNNETANQDLRSRRSACPASTPSVTWWAGPFTLSELHAMNLLILQSVDGPRWGYRRSPHKWPGLEAASAAAGRPGRDGHVSRVTKMQMFQSTNHPEPDRKRRLRLRARHARSTYRVVKGGSGYSDVFSPCQIQETSQLTCRRSIIEYIQIKLDKRINIKISVKRTPQTHTKENQLNSVQLNSIKFNSTMIYSAQMRNNVLQ